MIPLLLCCTSSQVREANGRAADDRASVGQLIFDTIYSPALAGNLLGDSANRSVIIYLPPSYTRTEKRYPVLYLLHGFTQRNTAWVDGTFQGLNIGTAMDSLISAGAVREMIIVMPDAYNRYRGAHYVNSPVIGNWSDFVTRDLITYTDGTYRTTPSAAAARWQASQEAVAPFSICQYKCRGYSAPLTR